MTYFQFSPDGTKFDRIGYKQNLKIFKLKTKRYG